MTDRCTYSRGRGGESKAIWAMLTLDVIKKNCRQRSKQKLVMRGIRGNPVSATGSIPLRPRCTFSILFDSSCTIQDFLQAAYHRPAYFLAAAIFSKISSRGDGTI